MYDHILSKIFVNGWKDTYVSVYGKKVDLIEDLISENTGIPMGGKKVFRNREAL